MALPTDFTNEVFSIVAQIPSGCVATYGQIARLASMPGYARHVGHALCNAPREIPCHRVVNAAGRTAPGGRSSERFSKKRAWASRPMAASI